MPDALKNAPRVLDERALGAPAAEATDEFHIGPTADDPLLPPPPAQQNAILDDKGNWQVLPRGNYQAQAMASESAMGFAYSQDRGWVFLDGPSGKSGHRWNEPGFDGVAIKITGKFELHIAEEKSTRGAIKSAPAVTAPNLDKHLETLAAYLEDPRFNEIGPPIEKARRAIATARACRANGLPLPEDVVIAVTSWGEPAKNVAPSLQRKLAQIAGVPGSERPPSPAAGSAPMAASTEPAVKEVGEMTPSTSPREALRPPRPLSSPPAVPEESTPVMRTQAIAGAAGRVRQAMGEAGSYGLQAAAWFVANYAIGKMQKAQLETDIEREVECANDLIPLYAVTAAERFPKAEKLYANVTIDVHGQDWYMGPGAGWSPTSPSVKLWSVSVTDQKIQSEEKKKREYGLFVIYNSNRFTFSYEVPRPSRPDAGAAPP